MSVTYSRLQLIIAKFSGFENIYIYYSQMLHFKQYVFLSSTNIFLIFALLNFYVFAFSLLSFLLCIFIFFTYFHVQKASQRKRGLMEISPPPQKKNIIQMNCQNNLKFKFNFVGIITYSRTTEPTSSDALITSLTQKKVI